MGAGGWESVLERTAALLVQLGDAPWLTEGSFAGVQANVCIAVGANDDTVSVDEAREYASYIFALDFGSVARHTPSH